MWNCSMIKDGSWLPRSYERENQMRVSSAWTTMTLSWTNLYFSLHRIGQVQVGEIEHWSMEEKKTSLSWVLRSPSQKKATNPTDTRRMWFVIGLFRPPLLPIPYNGNWGIYSSPRSQISPFLIDIVLFSKSSINLTSVQNLLYYMKIALLKK